MRVVLAHRSSLREISHFHRIICFRAGAFGDLGCHETGQPPGTCGDESEHTPESHVADTSSTVKEGASDREYPGRGCPEWRNAVRTEAEVHHGAWRRTKVCLLSKG